MSWPLGNDCGLLLGIYIREVFASHPHTWIASYYIIQVTKVLESENGGKRWQRFKLMVQLDIRANQALIFAPSVIEYLRAALPSRFEQKLRHLD